MHILTFLIHSDIKSLRNVESIFRSVLSYPSQPAVIMAASFSLMDKIEMGVDAHLPVAQYYDVPESYIPFLFWPFHATMY